MVRTAWILAAPMALLLSGCVGSEDGSQAEVRGDGSGCRGWEADSGLIAGSPEGDLFVRSVDLRERGFRLTLQAGSTGAGGFVFEIVAPDGTVHDRLRLRNDDADSVSTGGRVWVEQDVPAGTWTLRLRATEPVVLPTYHVAWSAGDAPDRCP